MTNWPESPPDPPEPCRRCGSENLSDHVLVDDDEDGPHYACVLLGEAEREDAICDIDSCPWNGQPISAHPKRDRSHVADFIRPAAVGPEPEEEF